MGRFSRILPRRRWGKADDEEAEWTRRWAKDGPPLQDSADFHQLNSKRSLGVSVQAKKGTRTGKNRIIATSSPAQPSSPALPSSVDGEEPQHIDSLLDEPGVICEFCSMIDFPRLLDWKVGQPRPWIPLSHVLSDTSSCPYCTFFQAMIGDISRAATDSTQSPIAENTGTFTPYFRIRQAFEKVAATHKHELGGAVLFEVTTRSKTLPRGYIIRATEDETASSVYTSDVENGATGSTNSLSSKATSVDALPVVHGRAVTPLLDPLLVKSWIKFCDDNPTESAKPKIEMVSPVGLKLVDCHDGKIIEADDELAKDLKYVTLSYVPDDPAGDDAEGESPAVDLTTALFADAIGLTSSLGYQYLWIEKFCQPEPASAAELQKNLSAKAKIFSNSILTIIAANGESNAVGIHGVSVPREEPLSLQTEVGFFTTTLLRSDLEIGASAWASHAWTMQDGAFAQRQLVLTPSQVYFQSGKVHCHESVSMPLRLTATVSKGRVFEVDTKFGPEDYRHQVSLFLGRRHYRPSQRLDLFRSTLDTFAKAEKGTENLIGLPLFHPDHFENVKVVSQTDRLAVGLGWMTVGNKTSSAALETLMTDLKPFADVENPTGAYVMDPGLPFPSWSWLAWRLRENAPLSPAGPCARGFLFNYVNGKSEPAIDGITAPRRMEISVGFEDGMLLSWEIDGEAIARRALKIDFLHITTYCFDIRLVRAESGQMGLEKQIATAMGHATSLIVLEGVRSACADGNVLPDCEEIVLKAVLVSGKHWRRPQPDELGKPSPKRSEKSLATALICAHRNWDTSKPLIRIGAISLSFTEFVEREPTPSDTGSNAHSVAASTGDGQAMLRGVDSGMGMHKGDIFVSLNQVDLY
ncbi:hypothetical protein VHEMI01072 [[Torrubiella] hemipterigena]|uniref:Heterokaryon incompatibility domain-containing protein n=1 Tax=[Torrubiella] hemipterigena TaxID=1531966 RepID=A0A0A1T6C3_9HYPO|nr:hypothetical protein VHEMI01072 [[Torrubiella] hemipterigena]